MADARWSSKAASAALTPEMLDEMFEEIKASPRPAPFPSPENPWLISPHAWAAMRDDPEGWRAMCDGLEAEGRGLLAAIGRWLLEQVLAAEGK